MEDIFFKVILRTLHFRIFEFRLHFVTMGNIRHEVFLSQLKNYNIAHNKKLNSEKLTFTGFFNLDFRLQYLSKKHNYQVIKGITSKLLKALPQKM